MKKFILLIAFFLGIAMATYIVYKEGVLPVDKFDTSKRTFVVAQGDSVDVIINKLSLEKLIRNRMAFYVVIKQMGIEKQIQAGDFNLSPSMDAFEIAQNLTKGSLDVWVTIPEGLRKEEVAEILTKELPSFSSSEFLSKAEEGYLFPDTYLMPKGANAENIIEILANTYWEKYNSEILAKAKTHNLTEKEVLILASIIEREVRHSDERVPVASILLRRLEEPMRLQVDASVQYALGYQKDMKSWWKRSLYFDDLEIDSPYNTYKNDGLPIGPICNPGLAALQAVVEADPNTPYLYYLHDSNGIIHLAKTLEEHNANVKKYIQ